MSMRDKFLKDFDYVSNNFSDHISVCYASDFNNLLGISYFELNKISNALSQYFLKHFGRNSQYIGVSLSDYFFIPCIILAIWKSGYCFAGVASQYTKKNNLDFLNFLGIKFIISDSIKNDYDGELVSQFAINERIYYVWDIQFQIKQDELGSLENICYGIMTSGSTGEPKMIQVPWSCILSNAVELSDNFQLTKLDCIFQGSPYSFDPFFIELLMSLLSGCSLMIVSNEIKLCPSALLRILFGVIKINFNLSLSTCSSEEKENYFHINLQMIEKKHISILQMTPSVFKRWTDKEIQEVILSKDTPLRILILGGEKFPTEILKLKSHDNKTRIFNIYGITEISCWAFLNEIANYSNNRISIGKPLNDIVYKINKNGELEIGSIARVCYVNEEKISEIKNLVFRKTGDVMELVENEIYYISRTNQIVKKYGMKINLNKIEYFFLNKNKLVKECYAIYDEENLKLGLFYVPVLSKETGINYKLQTLDFFKNHYTISEDDIKDIEKPDYIIEIMKAPLNSHGKIDRKELLHFLKSIKTRKPELDMKNIFKQIWVEILGTDQNNLFSSSFTELGGNSVLALNLIAKLEEEGFSVPQNFINVLLGKESYEECLKCLSCALKESVVPIKKFKFDLELENIKLSIGWKFDLEKCVDATPTFFTYQGEERIIIGSHSSKLSCLNPNFGCDIWTIFLGDRIESGFRPTKDGSKGFIGCYDHYVYCIACSDGSIMWKFKTGDMVKSTPCLSTNEKIVYVGSYDTNLYCLSVDNGKPEAIVKLSSGGIFSSGIISDSLNNFYIGTLDGTCVAINQQTNQPTWKVTLESPVFASPCLISNQKEIIFCEVLGIIHSFNALTETKIWSFKISGNIYSSPIVKELNNVNHIIFGCHDRHLYCLQYEKKPELKWKQQLDSSVFAKPSIIWKYPSVCAATIKGFIYLCDFGSGLIKTCLKLNGEIFSSPVYYNDKLFVGCRDNYIYGINIGKLE